MFDNFGNSKKTFAKLSFSSTLQVCNLEFPISTETHSKKNVSFECSEIVGYFLGKRCIMELFCQSNKITIYNLNAYKKSLPAFFWGCSKKLLIWKFQKIPRKTSLVEFFLSNWSCPIYRLQLYWKLTPSQMFLVSISRIFKTAVRTSLMKRFLSKVAREVSSYYNSVENSVTWIFLIK